jgi:hypothetical protein
MLGISVTRMQRTQPTAVRLKRGLPYLDSSPVVLFSTEEDNSHQGSDIHQSDPQGLVVDLQVLDTHLLESLQRLPGFEVVLGILALKQSSLLLQYLLVLALEIPLEVESFEPPQFAWVLVLHSRYKRLELKSLQNISQV